MRKPKTSYLSHYVTCIDDADVNRWTIFAAEAMLWHYIWPEAQD